MASDSLNYLVDSRDSHVWNLIPGVTRIHSGAAGRMLFGSKPLRIA
ncbi:MAG: hypothetical protein H0V44_00570 [Planctomycetes bacterium]|nr:hypothetical protein [Planctomycetota bacterium]